MKVGIVQFPGTNCEYDTQYAFEKVGAEKVSAEIIAQTFGHGLQGNARSVR